MNDRLTADLQKYFERKVGAQLARSVVLIPDPPPFKTHGYLYKAEILSVNDHFVVVNINRYETVPSGNTVAGSLVRFGDWALKYREYFGLDCFWADALETVDELDSATEVRATMTGLPR
jgi:hypothetical protein